MENKEIKKDKKPFYNKDGKKRGSFKNSKSNFKSNFSSKDKFNDKNKPLKDDLKKDFKEKKDFKKDNSNTLIEKKNVRYFAYLTLYNVFTNEAYVNIELDHIIKGNDISDLDRKLLTQLVYGTLQNERLLNWQIKKLSEKSPEIEAKIILLISLYQFNFLDRIPDFAIINEAVELAKNIKGEFLGKYVNAILREYTRQLPKPTLEEFKDNYEYYSTIYNMPIWVIKMLERHYGMNITLKILAENIKEAPLTLRVNTLKTSKEKLLENPDFKEGLLAKNSLIYVGDSLKTLPEFKEGLVSVQDESSQYVVEILDPQENEHILDMCAAPGSKTQYISNLMNNKGKILAIDIHEHRVNIMKKYLKELNITNTTCVTFDSTKLDTKEKLLESFDRVLLDAPCLGLGVIRRKPDILHGLKEETLDELNLVQAKLLEQAYKMLKHGGVLVYSTCSINKKENDSQIIQFLSKHKDMKREIEKQIFPYEYNSDGFYIARLIKE